MINGKVPRASAKRVDISILIAVTFAQVMEQREVYTPIKVCPREKWYMLISRRYVAGCAVDVNYVDIFRI